MLNVSKRVYADGVAVTYNELVKGLEFHIPSGMTVGEFKDWLNQHNEQIYKALVRARIANPDELIRPKAQKTKALRKGAKND